MMHVIFNGVRTLGIWSKDISFKYIASEVVEVLREYYIKLLNFLLEIGKIAQALRNIPIYGASDS